MLNLKLTWNCDGIGTAKLSKNDNLIFDIEYSHKRNGVGWRVGKFPNGINEDVLCSDESIIMQTYNNSEFEKKKEEAVLKTPISEDFLWTKIWERNLDEEEFSKLKEQLRFE